MHPVGPDGERAERPGDARALQGVEAACGVTGGVGGNAVALDDGGLDARLGEVVGDRAASGSTADYRNVLNLAHGTRLLSEESGRIHGYR